MTASFTYGAVGLLLAIVLFVWLLVPTEKQDAISLSHPSAGITHKDGETVSLRILESGSLNVNGVETTLDELRAILSASRDQHLIIETHDESQSEALLQVLDLARSRGVERISFVNEVVE